MSPVRVRSPWNNLIREDDMGIEGFKLEEGYLVKFKEKEPVEHSGLVTRIIHDMARARDVAIVDVRHEVDLNDIEIKAACTPEGITTVEVKELLGAALYALKMKSRCGVVDQVIIKVDEAIMWYDQLERG